ncbi:SPOR domain-containing protein [Microbulbifer sp. CnH-101-G]|uniref:SPOR domain-containing protein n=1 Tax=Microbulbifer sp. CnH-101-G TaxID=3243393 RepID=UPI0040391E89
MRWIALSLLLLNFGVFAWFVSTTTAEKERVRIADKRAEAQIQGITLVSEMSRKDLSPLAAPSAPPPAEHSAEQLCTLLGPFAEEFLGEAIVQRLKALQVDAILRDVEMQGQMRYWVFLPPLNSRREAYNRLRELQAQGIDSYVIPKGALADGISFGIFSERLRAESLTSELLEKGIRAQFREEPQTHSERWIVLAPGASDDLAPEFWLQLQQEYPDLDRRRNLCAEVAG